MTLVDRLNFYGAKREPIIFIIDYKKSQFDIVPICELNSDEVLFNIDGFSNFEDDEISNDFKFTKNPISFIEYQDKFLKIYKEIVSGNSYLLNLTSSTKIDINIELRDIIKATKAKFRIYYKDKFISFSPERFIKIESNKISTYPMKGTISADIDNAKEKILNNQKELAEHTMVVDLLRNDLSKVSKRVRVSDFRYIDRVHTNKGDLYQVSSKIVGELDNNWQDRLGNIIDSLLPAGSITGTPKIKTVEILDRVESHNREYFTGICGYFDGVSLDSGVMIRFIQKDNKNGALIYKSGGGITSDSIIQDEYKEMIEKVYVPVY